MFFDSDWIIRSSKNHRRFTPWQLDHWQLSCRTCRGWVRHLLWYLQSWLTTFRKVRSRPKVRTREKVILDQGAFIFFPWRGVFLTCEACSRVFSRVLLWSGYLNQMYLLKDVQEMRVDFIHTLFVLLHDRVVQRNAGLQDWRFVEAFGSWKTVFGNARDAPWKHLWKVIICK